MNFFCQIKLRKTKLFLLFLYYFFVKQAGDHLAIGKQLDIEHLLTPHRQQRVDPTRYMVPAITNIMK